MSKKIIATAVNTMRSNNTMKALTIVYENGSTETFPIYTDLDRVKKSFDHVTVFTNSMGSLPTTDIMYGDDNSIYQFVEGMIVRNTNMTGKDIINDSLFRNACDNLTDFCYLFTSEFAQLAKKISNDLEVVVESDEDYGKAVILKLSHPKFGDQRFVLVQQDKGIHYMTYMIMDAE